MGRRPFTTFEIVKIEKVAFSGRHGEIAALARRLSRPYASVRAKVKELRKKTPSYVARMRRITAAADRDQDDLRCWIGRAPIRRV